MERFCRQLLRWRGPILVGAALSTIAATAVALQVRFEFSFTQFFPSRDRAEVGRYFDFMDRFGRDDRVVLLALAPHGRTVDDAETLTAIAGLSQALRGLAEVARVDSPSTLRVGRSVDDALATGPLYAADDGIDAAEQEAVRRAMASHPALRGQLVSTDGTAALIAVTLQQAPQQVSAALRDDRDPVLPRIEQLARTWLPGARYTLHLGGVPVVRAGYVALLERETWLLLAAAGGLLALVLFALFRSLRAVVIPLFIVALSTLIAVAVLVLAGRGITLMSTMIPTIVLVIGISDTIHMLSCFQEARARGLDDHEAIVAAFGEVALPGLINSLTTAVGFVTLAVNAIGVIADFGLFAAVGVLAAYAVTALFLPPLLSALPIRGSYNLEVATRLPTGRLLARLYYLASRRARWVVLGFAVGCGGLALWAQHAVQREAFFVDDLPAGHPLLASTRFIEAHFGGILPLEVELAGPPGFAEDPAAARLALAVSRRLGDEPGVGAVVGYGEVIGELQQALGPDLVVDDRAGMAQLLLLADGADSELLDRFVAADRSAVRVSSRAADVGTRAMRARLSALERDFQRMVANSTVRLSVTGFTPAAVWVDDYMVTQLFYGFGGTFVVILLMIGLAFRSLKAALLSLPPNVVPLVAIVAWMAVAGIAIKPTSAIIFSVAFGLGADNTIFFLSRFRRELAAGNDARRALSRTLASTGRGVLFSSAVLSLGFAAALFAQLGASFDFGAMSIVTILSAGVGVLVLLPALLLWSAGPSRGTQPPTPSVD
jgi:hypothetical protein